MKPKNHASHLDYLQHLDHPQVALSVKQTKPMKLDDALSATLEMESY